MYTRYANGRVSRPYRGEAGYAPRDRNKFNRFLSEEGLKRVCRDFCTNESRSVSRFLHERVSVGKSRFVHLASRVIALNKSSAVMYEPCRTDLFRRNVVDGRIFLGYYCHVIYIYIYLIIFETLSVRSWRKSQVFHFRRAINNMYIEIQGKD